MNSIPMDTIYLAEAYIKGCSEDKELPWVNEDGTGDFMSADCLDGEFAFWLTTHYNQVHPDQFESLVDKFLTQEYDLSRTDFNLN